MVGRWDPLIMRGVFLLGFRRLTCGRDAAAAEDTVLLRRAGRRHSRLPR